MPSLRGKLRDPTVVAVPVYFATLVLEAAQLRRRGRRLGPSAGDYEARDTRASLLMGTASLVVPLAAPTLLRPFTPGRGRHGRAVACGALAAVAVTSIADFVVRRIDRRRHARSASAESSPATSPEPPVRRAARAAASAAGVSAVALGGVAAATTWASRTTPSSMFSRRVAPDLGTGPLALAFATVGWDFIYYWNHRLMHESRYMWAIHVVHHSSERYNLSTALRQPVLEPFGTFVPYGALCLFGIRPEVVATARGWNLLYQYWIHTETIGSLGSSEALLNSPSHHRVHHGSNPQYLDRNHGSILIVWDRLFGTFEPEGERVVYGLTKNINSFNPFVIVGHEYAEMARDVASAASWSDRLGYVVRGPGWARARRAELAATSARPAIAAAPA